MKIFRTKNELRLALDELKAHKKDITLVPTMGALHDGHISLINYARPKTDIIVCSIFVNPTQFNDPNDLALYPRPIEQDIALLEEANCDILFLPGVSEIYPEDDVPWEIDLGNLDKIWEGEHRPGHFQGVTQVVYKLFSIVQPDQSCFGQKDFQQVMVIKRMIEIKNLPVSLLICPTVRNKHGLALSSRNARLSAQGKQKALAIYNALLHIKNAKQNKSPEILLEEAKQILKSESSIKLEYIAICEDSTLQEAKTFQIDKRYVVIIAAWLEGIRLIDNMLL